MGLLKNSLEMGINQLTNIRSLRYISNFFLRNIPPQKIGSQLLDVMAQVHGKRQLQVIVNHFLDLATGWGGEQVGVQKNLPV